MPDLEGVTSNDVVIAVMGLTGSGKSTFIARACNNKDDKYINHSILRCNSDIRIVKTIHDNRNIVFIDTPGFDNDEASDTVAVTQVAEWLHKASKANVTFSAIIYLHRITDNRMSGPSREHLKMFAGLCGKNAMPNIVLVTTMWNNLIDKKIGRIRENELKEDFWAEMRADGCRTERFEDTHESAWKIIGSTPTSGTSLELQEEVARGDDIFTTKVFGLLHIPRWLNDLKLQGEILKNKQTKVKPERLDFPNRKAPKQNDIIIVVMGPAGSGKSTFIQCASEQEDSELGRNSKERMQDIRLVRSKRSIDGRYIVFVDTPGFNDPHKSDIEILSLIRDWLVRAYGAKVKINGILYLYRISDDQITGSSLKNPEFFASICGNEAIPNMTLVTTMWSQVPGETGDQQEKELKKFFRNGMIDKCCTIVRFGDSTKSALDIVQLCLGDDKPLLLTHQVVDRHKTHKKTEAGITLNRQLQKLLKDQKYAEKMLTEQPSIQGDEQARAELERRNQEIEQEIEKSSEQISGLTFRSFWPFGRRKNAQDAPTTGPEAE